MSEATGRIVSMTSTTVVIEGDFTGSDLLIHRPGREVEFVAMGDLEDLRQSVWSSVTCECTSAEVAELKRELSEAREEIAMLRAGKK